MAKIILCYILGWHDLPFKESVMIINKFIQYNWCYRCKLIVGTEYKKVPKK